ncbi:flavanone 3-dioxygenase 3-like [Andrographis paniculata]|uniref:flavanone 3-dioxygenase 3-like n=1 Tax=Andrographis paniculata TaxID=175694 RepID=UPI0021E8D798|nr:flavanone 3-dioxygenase 3-like [Andrographis paniculata]
MDVSEFKHLNRNNDVSEVSKVPLDVSEFKHLDKNNDVSEVSKVPLIDFKGMCHPVRRTVIVEEIVRACTSNGFFQVINHGVPQGTLDGALSVAASFFELPYNDKAKFMSSDVHNPVRFGTTLGIDRRVPFRRVFLKHYAHPLRDWVGLWPDTPSDYREKMGEYVVEVQKLARTIMAALTEGLGLGGSYLSTELDDGMQVMAINCYPPCPQPALGLPPHSDYSCLTIVLQDSSGLQILDSSDMSWKTVPMIPGALQVNVGDHLEVVSNGRYKSVAHKVTINSDDSPRLSLASLHSLGMDVKVEAARELVDAENPEKYRRSSFRDFLNFISENDIGEGCSFLNTLKIRM